ncbi:MAG: PUA domain-containing protein [Nitrosopumilaceae archaeon]
MNKEKTISSHLISKSETAAILDEISSKWKIDIPKIKNLKCYYLPDDAEIITGNGVTILKTNGEYLPFLSSTEVLEKFPHVIVDMGAVKFVCNGANVMRPGIRKYTNFEKDQIVCVKEESKQKFLAVGKSLVSSAEMELLAKGEVVKNLHYISDEYWEAKKEIRD